MPWDTAQSNTLGVMIVDAVCEKTGRVQARLESQSQHNDSPGKDLHYRLRWYGQPE